MASFCAQCSIDIWGHDDKDYAGQTTEEQTKERIYARVLCEGCGGTWVDHRGFCVSPKCMHKHGILVEEAETGDLLQAKPFEYNDVPVEGPSQEEVDRIASVIGQQVWSEAYATSIPDPTDGKYPVVDFDDIFGALPPADDELKVSEPVGKEWLEGIDDAGR